MNKMREAANHSGFFFLHHVFNSAKTHMKIDRVASIPYRYDNDVVHKALLAHALIGTILVIIVKE